MRLYFTEELAMTLNATKDSFERGPSYLILSFLLLVANNESKQKNWRERCVLQSLLERITAAKMNCQHGMMY